MFTIHFLRILYVSLICFSLSPLAAAPIPLGFSIPACKLIAEIPEKTQDFATCIPGVRITYIFDNESDYYADYQKSYFALTCKKHGWDCMRHYEILANGCIPYFKDLDNCDPNTLYFFPRELVKEAMNLPGVSYLKIDHALFDKAKYEEILKKLMAYTAKYLTAKKMTQYMLDKINYKGSGNILFIPWKLEASLDYLSHSTLIGLRELYGSRVVDYPKVDYLYKTYTGNRKKLYGKGFSYSMILDDLEINREDIEKRIANKEFDLILYLDPHHNLLFHDLVLKTYETDQIVYICGYDIHENCECKDFPNFFLREFESIK